MCATRDVVDRLSIRAAAEEVRTASEWLAQSGQAQGVPDEQIGRLDLSLNEVLANVLAHAGPSAATAPVELYLEVASSAAGGRAVLTVSDAGMPFNPLAQPERPKPQTLAEAVPGGLGLIMLKSNSDHLAYRHGEGRNHLSFGVSWTALARE